MYAPIINFKAVSSLFFCIPLRQDPFFLTLLDLRLIVFFLVALFRPLLDLRLSFLQWRLEIFLLLNKKILQRKDSFIQFRKI